jgi:hypothetical protein
MEEDLPLTLRLRVDDLRAARTVVTDTQTIALLDQAIRHLDVATDPAAWRDHWRVRPEHGAQVFASLQSARGGLRALIDNRRLIVAWVEESTLRYHAVAWPQPGEHCARRGAGGSAPEGRPSRANAEDWVAQRPNGRVEGDAIGHYLAAWQIAVEAMAQATPQVTPRVTPAP